MDNGCDGVSNRLRFDCVLNRLFRNRFKKKHHSSASLAFVRALQWHHNGLDGISNHQPHHCLLNHLFRHRSKKAPKLCVTDLCVGNSTVTGEFPTQMASNSENVSIWWSHHGNSLVKASNAENISIWWCHHEWLSKMNHSELITWPQRNKAQQNHVHILWDIFSSVPFHW